MQSRATRIAVRDTMLIRGPATLRLQDGEAEVLGMRLTYEEPIFVRRGKVLPLEPIAEQTYITATFGLEGGIIRKQARCGTKMWAKAADLLQSTPEKTKKVMVVGASDSGKSTLTTYLSNLAVAKGLKVGIVDADIGQSDLAPPGCVGGAILSKQIVDLRDIRGEVMKFVGSTSPMGLEEVVIDAVKAAADQVERIRPDLILINTDGYVEAEGVEYKVKMVETLSPDQVVFIVSESRSRLQEKLTKMLGERVLPLESAEGVTKSSSDRVERRISQFHRYLKNSRVTRCSLNSCTIQLLGKQYTLTAGSEGLGQLEISDTADDAIMASAERLVMPRRALEGMFVALGDDEVKGFGCILRCSGNYELNILTPTHSYSVLHLSLIKLNERFTRDERIPLRYLNTYTPHRLEDIRADRRRV